MTPTSRTTVAESTTSSTTIPPTTLPPLSTIGALPAELHATFAVLLATSDVRRGDEAGFWYLTLTPGKGYAFGRVPSDPGQNTGVLTVSAGTVTFSAERGQGPCDAAGTYRWTKTGDILSFTVVNDPCSVRLPNPLSRIARGARNLKTNQLNKLAGGKTRCWGAGLASCCFRSAGCGLGRRARITSARANPVCVKRVLRGGVCARSVDPVARGVRGS